MKRHAPHVPFSVPMKDLDSQLWDLNDLNVYTNTAINAVPGLKTSAAFFTFLRANLVLPSSTLNSNTSTPLLYPSSSHSLPPLRGSSLATMTSHQVEDVVPSTNPLDEVPPLVTTTLTNEDDKVAALKLVADSIAQQRQSASRSLIFHPVILAVYVLVLAVVNQFLYKSRGDIGVVVTTTGGLTMVALVGVRAMTGKYLEVAEKFNWAFATNEDGDQDIIIGSRYGEEIIGATILRLERSSNGGNKKKPKGFKTGGEAHIRAWTVRVKYRGKGVGTEMLEEAIKVSREKLGNSAKIGFAVEHANSTMVLPEFFNGNFRKSEARAAKALQKTIQEMDAAARRR